MFARLMVILLLLAPAYAFGSESLMLGPLRVRERNPLYNLYLVPNAESARLTPVNGVRLEVNSGYSNIWERSLADQSLLQDFDLEMAALDLTARWGAGSRLELGATMSGYGFYGGFLDYSIQEWHDLFGLPNDNREDVPNDRYALAFRDLNGPIYLNAPRKNAFRPGNLRLFAKYQLNPGDDDRPWVLIGWAQFPTGKRNMTSSGEPGIAFAIAHERFFGRIHMAVNLGAATISDESSRRAFIPESDSAAFAMAALSLPLGRGVAFTLQTDAATPYIDVAELDNLNKPPVNISLGFSGASASGTYWQLGFSEDITADGPSVDFTLNMSIGKQW